MMPRVCPGHGCEARQVVTQMEGHGGGHGNKKRVLTAGGAGEDDPEELAEEEADVPAEGCAVLGVEVRLVQRDQAKDPSPVATQYGSTDDAVHGELLRRAEEEDNAAGVPLEAVQAGDKRLPHDVRRKLINMMGFRQGISQGPLPETLQKIRDQRE